MLLIALGIGGGALAQQPDSESQQPDSAAQQLDSETQGPVWVTDELRVPLRSGPSGEHRILHWGLPSGTELVVLGVDVTANFTQVRTADGMEGWIPSQYIDRVPIARNLLEDAQVEIRSLRQQLEQQQARNREALLDEFENAWREDFETLIAEHRNEQQLEPWVWLLIGGGLVLLGLLLGVAIKSRPRRSPW